MRGDKIVKVVGGEEKLVDNPAFYPEKSDIEYVKEPIVRLFMIAPLQYQGTLLQLSMDYRGEVIETTFLSEDRIKITFLFPLGEIITDFFNRIKETTSGFARLAAPNLYFFCLLSDLIHLSLSLWDLSRISLSGSIKSQCRI